MNRSAVKAAALLSSAALPLAGTAQETPQAQDDESTNPYVYPDDSFISLSGRVSEVEMNRFRLDFADGSRIRVEMDDADRDADSYSLEQGDAVTVYGKVDNDLFETNTIEANAVYVEKLDTFFRSSDADEEGYDFVNAPPIEDASKLIVQGAVTDVSETQFSMDTGSREIQVSVEQLPSDPLDDEGYQQLEVGDVVSVTGGIDYEFTEGRRIAAETVRTINDWDT